MKTHVRVLVCGDEQVGKSSFISTVIARHFPERVPPVMADVHIPPEENDDDVHCTISDSSALVRDQPQLLESLKNAESIVLMYDVARLETLTHLDTFWLPLIEANTEDVPVIIVRNKVDLLPVDPTVGGRSDEDLSREMAPLQERYKVFHNSLECSSVNQVGISQVFHHALTAALYPIGPLLDAKTNQLRPRFDRAIRRLFRIYDRDGDGLLGDQELNSFQYESFRLNLSDEDIVVLKQILTKVAAAGSPETPQPVLVVPPSEEGAGGVTVDGFIRLMRLFIDKKQMKAPWKALYSHNYDERVNLPVPAEVMDPPPGPLGGGWHDQVLSAKAERFVLSLFDQFSSPAAAAAATTEASTERALTQEGQNEIFRVIPDPACAAWDTPRSTAEFDWQEGSYELFGRLRRAPGAVPEMTLEGWVAHWQMLAAHSPLLARAHLFYAGFRDEVDDMLVSAEGKEGGKRRGQQQGGARRAVIQAYVLGRRGCGRGRVVRGLRLGDNLRFRQQTGVPGAAATSEPEDEPEFPETCAAFACIPATLEVSPELSRLQCVTVTEVPEAFTDAFVQEQAWRCEVAVLVFDPSSRESLDYITRMQAVLPEDVPRVVVACLGASGRKHASIVHAAEEMCKELEISPPSVVVPESGEGLEGLDGLRERITDPDGPGLLPHAEQHRKRKDRKRTIRTASIVTLGLVAAVAVAGYYAYSLGGENGEQSTTKPGGANGESWKTGMGGALRSPVRVAQHAAAAAVDYWRRWRSAGTTIGREAVYFRAGTAL